MVHGSPGAGEFKVRWPALFHIDEVHACFPPLSLFSWAVSVYTCCDLKDGISLHGLIEVD